MDLAEESLLVKSSLPDVHPHKSLIFHCLSLNPFEEKRLFSTLYNYTQNTYTIRLKSLFLNVREMPVEEALRRNACIPL
jgi:hypothetical protein